MPKKPQPFSEEELQGLKQGNFRLTEKFSGEIVANWIDRFLDTITAKNKRIWHLEKLIAIEADKRASDRQKIDIITTQTAEIERLRDNIKKVKQKVKKVIKKPPTGPTTPIMLANIIVAIMNIVDEALDTKEESNANGSDR